MKIGLRKFAFSVGFVSLANLQSLAMASEQWIHWQHSSGSTDYQLAISSNRVTRNANSALCPASGRYVVPTAAKMNELLAQGAFTRDDRVTSILTTDNGQGFGYLLKVMVVVVGRLDDQTVLHAVQEAWDVYTHVLTGQFKYLDATVDSRAQWYAICMIESGDGSNEDPSDRPQPSQLQTYYRVFVTVSGAYGLMYEDDARNNTDPRVRVEGPLFRNFRVSSNLGNTELYICLSGPISAASTRMTLSSDRSCNIEGYRYYYSKLEGKAWNYQAPHSKLLYRCDDDPGKRLTLNMQECSMPVSTGLYVYRPER